MSANGRWTVDGMPDQSGRTVIVTGANSGIGLTASRAFARKGARVVMACRSTERGERARREIEADVPEASLDVLECDLADLSSIRAFAGGVLERYDDLHVLCNNAGVMAIPREETADGFEMQFGVNHLGHFALTGRLLERLLETDGDVRVVTQSSGLHENGAIDFENLHGRDEYDPWDAYARSKLANLLFAYELDRRFAAAGADAISVGCHPGFAATNLQLRGPRASGSTLRLWLMRLLNAVVAQSAEMGALPLLYAATADGVEGGDYVGPGGFMNMRGYPETQRSSERSYDRSLARRLWEVSEEETGVRFGLVDPSTRA